MLVLTIHLKLDRSANVTGATSMTEPSTTIPIYSVSPATSSQPGVNGQPVPLSEGSSPVELSSLGLNSPTDIQIGFSSEAGVGVTGTPILEQEADSSITEATEQQAGVRGKVDTLLHSNTEKVDYAASFAQAAQGEAYLLVVCLQICRLVGSWGPPAFAFLCCSAVLR